MRLLCKILLRHHSVITRLTPHRPFSRRGNIRQVRQRRNPCRKERYPDRQLFPVLLYLCILPNQLPAHRRRNLNEARFIQLLFIKPKSEIAKRLKRRRGYIPIFCDILQQKCIFPSQFHLAAVFVQHAPACLHRIWGNCDISRRRHIVQQALNRCVSIRLAERLHIDLSRQFARRIRLIDIIEFKPRQIAKLFWKIHRICFIRLIANGKRTPKSSVPIAGVDRISMLILRKLRGAHAIHIIPYAVFIVFSVRNQDNVMPFPRILLRKGDSPLRPVIADLKPKHRLPIYIEHRKVKLIPF